MCAALDVCQHAPKFIADKTCLGAPGGRILAKCGTKFVRFGSGQNLSAGCFISLLLSLFWWRTQPSKICRNLSEKINAFFYLCQRLIWMLPRIIGLVFSKGVLFLHQIPDPSHILADLCYSYETPRRKYSSISSGNWGQSLIGAKILQFETYKYGRDN